MATDNKRTSRKRKAKEADIDDCGNEDIKRMKIHSPDNSNDSNKEISAVPFASFAATKSTGFSSLLQPESTHTAIDDHQNQEEEQSTKKKPESSPMEQSQSADGASSGWLWGNASNDNQFVFDNDTSQFTFDEVDSNHNHNNKNNKNDADINVDDRNNENSKEGEEEKPIALLTGIVDSGDKNDETIYELKCKVWLLDTNKKSWNEKGIGIVKLNTYSNNCHDEKDKKLNVRLLCRTDVTLKTIINAIIKKDTSFNKANQENIQFTVFEQVLNDKKEDDDDEDREEDKDKEFIIVTKTYCLRSKETDKEKIDIFLSKIKELQDKM